MTLRFDVSPTLFPDPNRLRLTASCERKWERDAQVITPVLILSSWTPETHISLSPVTPMATTSHWQPPELPSNPRTSVCSGNGQGSWPHSDPEFPANTFARRLQAFFPSTQNTPASTVPSDSTASSRRRESLPPRFLKVRIVTWNMHDSLPKVGMHLPFSLCV